MCTTHQLCDAVRQCWANNPAVRDAETLVVLGLTAAEAVNGESSTELEHILPHFAQQEVARRQTQTPLLAMVAAELPALPRPSHLPHLGRA